jgi:hypothetical protein
MNTAAPPPMNVPNALAQSVQQQYQPQLQQAYRPPGAQMVTQVIQQPTIQSAPGFPPGAHINPQVYPGFGMNTFQNKTLKYV